MSAQYQNALKPNHAFKTGHGRSANAVRYDDPRLGISPGDVWCVDTVDGSDTNPGTTWDAPFKTMARAAAAVSPNDTIIFIGTVAEQIVAPLGVTGVSVIGAVGGNTRHDDGARWKEAAVAGNAPLLVIREQGWEFHNFLFVPQTGYSAIRAWRAEDATHPDSSHFLVSGVKFIGNVAFGAAGGGIGIEDWGGNHHYRVEDCEFISLAFGIVAPAGSPGIAAPLRNRIERNVFEGNTNDVCMDANRCIVRDNTFATKYAGGHPNTLNLAYLSDVSGANLVLDNTFADAAADVTIAKGYKPSTGDIWRNRVTNTAADIVAVPA